MIQDSPLPYQQPEPQNWYMGFIQGKTRIVIAWVFAALLVLSARDYPNGLGIAICFFGATLRFWASGYLRKDSSLAIGGPYRLTRNPLYLGTYLMAVGTAVSVDHVVFALAVSIVFGVLYHSIIKLEEIKLQVLFGAAYTQYCAAVPRFFPRPWPASKEALKGLNPNPAAFEHDWQISLKNKSYEAYVTFLALIGFVVLVAKIWMALKS